MKNFYTSSFSQFAKWASKKLGSSSAFIMAMLLIFLWLIIGIFYHFSTDWLLILNTGATIVTVLMVFVLQNSQNRNTIALHLKLDEIIRAMHSAHNELLKVEQLSDEALDELLKRYESLADDVRNKIKKGQDDIGTPEVKK